MQKSCNNKHEYQKKVILRKTKNDYPEVLSRMKIFLDGIKRFPIAKWHNHDLRILDCLKDFMTKECFNESLFRSYTSQDTGKYHNSLLVRLFSSGDKRLLMWWKDDYRKFQELPEEITIYRGCSQENVKRTSWSTMQKNARTMGHNFEQPFLFKAVISKKDVFFYTNYHGEKDIVVNPDRIKSEKIIGKIPPKQVNKWF